VASSTTRTLLVSATAVNGLLAGGNLDRAFVQMPAWARVGSKRWAEYSRHADLSVNGKLLYPLEGIGGAILTITAAISYLRDGRSPRRAAVPMYSGVAFVVGGMLATTRAAPAMLGLMRSNRLPEEIAFKRFRFWGNVRGVFQILAFIATLQALVVVLSKRRS
jgi:hypothetical protein